MNSTIRLLTVSLFFTGLTGLALPLHGTKRISTNVSGITEVSAVRHLLKKDKYYYGNGSNRGSTYEHMNSNSNNNGKTNSNGDYTQSSGSSDKTSKGALQFRFNNGQCTDWADARYAQLTGYHVGWSGDASTWASSARNSAGWTVSSQPKVPSIIAIQPGVQGVGGDGHVAVVESIQSSGEVYTSNYNYNGGPYDKTYVTFKTGSGVSFIWHN